MRRPGLRTSGCSRAPVSARLRLGVVVRSEKPEAARAIVIDERVDGLVKGSRCGEHAFVVAPINFPEVFRRSCATIRGLTRWQVLSGPGAAARGSSHRAVRGPRLHPSARGCRGHSATSLHDADPQTRFAAAGRCFSSSRQTRIARAFESTTTSRQFSGRSSTTMSRPSAAAMRPREPCTT